MARNISPRDGDDWVYLLRHLRKHDTRVVLELLSAFAGQDGGVSLPSFYGCIRALVEVTSSQGAGEHVRIRLMFVFPLLFNNVRDRGSRFSIMNNIYWHCVERPVGCPFSSLCGARWHVSCAWDPGGQVWRHY